MASPEIPLSKEFAIQHLTLTMKASVMTIYKSKIGYGILVPIMVLFGGGAALMYYNRIFVMFFVLLLMAAFVIHLFLTTCYTILDNKLNIKCGFLYDKSIDIQSIKKISETNNPISSPATSLDRLEIRYNKWDSIIISPKDKRGLISQLLKMNPGIEVKLKTN